MEEKAIILLVLTVVILCLYSVLLKKNDKRYVLVHLVMVDDSTLRAIVTKGFRRLENAQNAMVIQSNKLIGEGSENMYYTNFIQTEMDVKLQIHDITHYLEIQRL